jgi:hypothetical protein
MTKDEALTLEALKYAASKGYGRLVREMKIAPFTIKGDEALAQPAPPPPPPECKTEAEQIAYAFGWWQALESVRTKQPAQEPRNFCPRCGKRTADLTVIHTCTPPKGGNT